jgi:hypothetical protein
MHVYFLTYTRINYYYYYYYYYYHHYYYCCCAALCWALADFWVSVGRTPWTGDQLIASPLPIHRINAHNTCTDIHAFERATAWPATVICTLINSAHQIWNNATVSR